jgi:hypothetical protein
MEVGKVYDIKASTPDLCETQSYLFAGCFTLILYTGAPVYELCGIGLDEYLSCEECLTATTGSQFCASPTPTQTPTLTPTVTPTLTPTQTPTVTPSEVVQYQFWEFKDCCTSGDTKIFLIDTINYTWLPGYTTLANNGQCYYAVSATTGGIYDEEHLSPSYTGCTDCLDEFGCPYEFESCCQINGEVTYAIFNLLPTYDIDAGISSNFAGTCWKIVSDVIEPGNSYQAIFGAEDYEDCSACTTAIPCETYTPYVFVPCCTADTTQYIININTGNTWNVGDIISLADFPPPVGKVNCLKLVSASTEWGILAYEAPDYSVGNCNTCFVDNSVPCLPSYEFWSCCDNDSTLPKYYGIDDTQFVVGDVVLDPDDGLPYHLISATTEGYTYLFGTPSYSSCTEAQIDGKYCNLITWSAQNCCERFQYIQVYGPDDNTVTGKTFTYESICYVIGVKGNLAETGVTIVYLNELGGGCNDCLLENTSPPFVYKISGCSNPIGNSYAKICINDALELGSAYTLTVTGTTDTAGQWNIDPTFTYGTGFGSGSSIILDIEIDNNGDYFVAGSFSGYNGTTAYNLIKISQNGTLDTSFLYTGFSGDVLSRGVGYTDSNSIVYDFELIGEDLTEPFLIAVGNFSGYSGSPSINIIGLTSGGTIESNFATGTGIDDGPGARYAKDLVSRVPKEYVVVGPFSSYQGGSVLRKLRLDNSANNFGWGGAGPSGGDTSVVEWFGVTKFVVGGSFTSWNGTSSQSIAILDNGGFTSQAFPSGFNNVVDDIKILSNGDLIVAGSFTSFSGQSVIGLAKLVSPGYYLDTTFTGFTGFSKLLKIDILNDTIMVVGDFNDYRGVSSRNIIILNSDGTIRDSFGENFSGSNVIYECKFVNSLDTIILGGKFTSYKGTSANKIVRLIKQVDTCYNIIEVFPCLECSATTVVSATTIQGPFIDCSTCNSEPEPSNTPTPTITKTPTTTPQLSQSKTPTPTPTLTPTVTTNCCSTWALPGPTGFTSNVYQITDCNNNLDTILLTFNTTTRLICAKSATKLQGDPQQPYLSQACVCPTPTPTKTTTKTPTKTPTNTPTITPTNPTPTPTPTDYPELVYRFKECSCTGNNIILVKILAFVANPSDLLSRLIEIDKICYRIDTTQYTQFSTVWDIQYNSVFSIPVGNCNSPGCCPTPTPTNTPTVTPTPTFPGLYYFSGRNCCTNTFVNVGLYDLTYSQYQALLSASIGDSLTLGQVGGDTFCFEILGPAVEPLTFYYMLGNPGSGGCSACITAEEPADCCCPPTITNVEFGALYFGDFSTTWIITVSPLICLPCCDLIFEYSLNQVNWTVLPELGGASCNSINFTLQIQGLPQNLGTIYWRAKASCCDPDAFLQTSCPGCDRRESIYSPTYTYIVPTVTPTNTPTKTPTPNPTPTRTPNAPTGILIKDCCTNIVIGVYASNSEPITSEGVYYATLTGPSSPTLNGCYDFVFGPNTGYPLYTNYSQLIPQILCVLCIATQTPCNACGSGWQPLFAPYCVKFVYTSSIPPSSSVNVSKVNFASLGPFNGTLIYDTNFDVGAWQLNQPFVTTQIPLSNNYWKLTIGNLNSGPLNRSGVWTNFTNAPNYLPINQKLGFSYCYDGGLLTEPKVIYVGVASKGGFDIYNNGVLIVTTKFGVGYQVNVSGPVPFQLCPEPSWYTYWNIFPVIVYPGFLNNIEMLGWNRQMNTLGPSCGGGTAIFGFQIYDNTFQEIYNATSDGDLNILFDSASRVGQTFDIVYQPGNSNLLNELSFPPDAYSTSGSSCSDINQRIGCGGFDCVEVLKCAPLGPCLGQNVGGGALGYWVQFPTPTPTNV